MRIHVLVSAAALSLVSLTLAERDARAGLAACGDIDVRAEASCQVVASGGCDTQCVPTKFEAACAAKYDATCSTECNVDVSVDCVASCKTNCATTCAANPPQLDCAVSCKADCGGTCEGSCASSANKSECQASCKASCDGRCDASCTAAPPTASCDVKCDGKCQGSCKAKANVDCQTSCQARTFASCKATLQGGCKTQCEKPEGALFCDGNYVDTGNNLQTCVDALNAYLKSKVTVNATGSSSCDGGACSAEGTVDATVNGCSMSPSSNASPFGWFAGGAVALVGFALRRRR